MKKVITLVLALTMAVSLMACGNKENPTGMPNPTKEVASLEKLRETANCALIKPEGVEVADEAFFMIESDPQIAEYQFTVDGKKCSLRFATADAKTDISGVYGDEGTIYASYDSEGTVVIQNDDLQSQRWFTVDGQYVFTVFDGGEWEWTQFDGLVSQFANMEPKNWNSAVPFADYLALVGYYADDAMNIAAISIKDDHVAINVAAYLADGTRMFWDMDAVLDGGKLTYEKETVSQGVYDEDGGMSSTDLPDGGAGYVEIKDDGSLDFAGAYSEQLHGFAMAPYNMAG